MRYLKFLLLVTFIFSINSFAQESTTFKYVSPKPDSKLLSRETNIIFSLPEFINESSLTKQNLIKVTGSISGKHSGDLILSDDERTIVFNPANPFAAGETVTVILNPGIQTITGTAVEPLTFSFSITPLEEPIRLDPVERLGLGYTMEDLYSSQLPPETPALDSLPSDFPEITVGTVNNPAPGNIFVANIRFGNTNTDGFFMMILDSTGYPVKYKRSTPFPALDFDMQPNGLISYADISQLFMGYGFSQFKVMDTSFTVVDSFQCGNGYQADFHDFRLLPNGHALMIAYDPQPFDMSEIVPGGDPNAIVIGGIIQELDSDKNVVFQWRSWDYVDITDSYHELTGATVDYIHLNSVDLDNDGNILISSRHFSEVIKISRQTGEIIWRLGGKQNQFTFINENPDNAPNYFSFQHDARRIANGNLTLFDNGNQHSPPYSRGVEYELDEQNKTATLVWEYRHDPDVYGFATGSVQRLPNGNTVIGWGTASAGGAPVLTEVHPDKSVAYELFFPLELASYRAFKYPWVSGLPSASVTRYEVLEGNTYEFNDPGDTTAVKIKFNSFASILYNSVNVKLYDYAPNNPGFNERAPVIYPHRFVVTLSGIDSLNADIYFQLDHFPDIDNPNDIVVYERHNEGAGTFIPLNTTYNSNTNELKVASITDAGEFILGFPDIPDVPVTPVLVKPADGQIVNQELPLTLEWSSQGFAYEYHLQVSTDSNFTSLVVDETGLTELTYQMASLLPDQQYYWRARSMNESGYGDWSDAWSFTSAAPFITLTAPNGGETIRTDSSFAIKWNHNLMDSVKIELFRNGNFYSTIIDTLFSINGGYLWAFTDSIPSDTSYKVFVQSLSDNSLQDMSDASFTIEYIPVGVEQVAGLPENFKLEQNYPNPFNPSTRIRYSLPMASNITIKIYNSIGENVATLIDDYQSVGNYEVNWDAAYYASGIYFYSLEAIPSDGSQMYRSVKKMILLK